MDTPEIKASLQARLAEVQATLNAPKNKRNTFGNYNYRSCEDILEAVKPLLASQGLLLTLNDTLENIGNRYYIKATATIRLCDGADPGDIEEVSAYAREEEDKKGMDGSQITGTASSYARKYALNGLFLIDDTKDADTDEHHTQTASSPSQATTRQVDKPTAETTETEQDTPCEIPGCKNVVWGSKVAASRKFHKGHVICYTHSTNGDWEKALQTEELPF